MKILVLLPMNAAHRALLEAAAPGHEFAYCEGGAPEKTVRGAEIIIGNPPVSALRGTRALRWLQLGSAGAEAYIAPGVLPEGAALTNATGAYGLAISEHMLACLLTLMKRLNVYGLNQQRQEWKDEGSVSSVYGSRTLVVGCGDIGGEFARRMYALGSRVVGIRRSERGREEYLEAVHTMDALCALLPEMDVVAACLPGTSATRGVFGEEAFARMKRGAYFLNVGRGTAVNSLALAAALNSGHLAGAAIDVTDPEPLPPGHPLWEARNILITPHVSGGYHIPETLERIVDIAADNLRAFFAGAPMRNIVDFETGYRKL